MLKLREEVEGESHVEVEGRGRAMLKLTDESHGKLKLLRGKSHV